jgi:hypothetical protein
MQTGRKMVFLTRKDLGLVLHILGLELFHSHRILPLLILNHAIVSVLNNGRLILIIRLKVLIIYLPHFQRNIILLHLLINLDRIRILLELFA